MFMLKHAKGKVYVLGLGYQHNAVAVTQPVTSLSDQKNRKMSVGQSKRCGKSV